MMRVRAPSLDEVPALFATASFAIGAPLATPGAIASVLAHDPSALHIFERPGRIIGGVAFLHLAEEGMRRLIAGTIDLRDPDLSLLASPRDPPAGIYVWALFGRGRAGIGIAQVIETLRGARFRTADIWAAPLTADGRRFLRNLGFEAAFAESSCLYRYIRSPNRFQ